jgi:hypothetical protein
MHLPVGYLITVVVLAWCTLYAVAPRRPRHSSPSNRSYWFGFLLNELPFLAFYWLAASTWLALSEGVAGSRPAGQSTRPLTGRSGRGGAPASTRIWRSVCVDVSHSRGSCSCRSR